MPEPFKGEERRDYIANYEARSKQLGKAILQAQESEVPVSHAKKLLQDMQAQHAAFEVAVQLDGLLASERKAYSGLKVNVISEQMRTACNLEALIVGRACLRNLPRMTIIKQRTLYAERLVIK